MSLLKTGILISRRGFLISIVLFTLFLTLYSILSLLLVKHINPFPEHRSIVQASFNFVIAFSLVVSSFFIGRTVKLHCIYISLTSILIMIALIPFISNNVATLGVVLAIGCFFGTGLLAFLTYFWNLTVPEERGRIAGLIGFVALPIYSIANIVMASLDFLGTVTATALLSSGIILVIFLRPERLALTSKKDERRNYAEKRTVILYAIPWIAFSLINVTLARNASLAIVQGLSPSFHISLILYQTAGIIFGALFGGIAADFLGRRELLISSLTLYGISAVLVGLFTNGEILILAYAINGLSWGVLFILYTMVIWGDLSTQNNCALIYSIGLAIYYATAGIGFATQVSIPIFTSSLVSCLLVFLSNVPIAFAPELLPSEFSERIKLKLHIRKVKKIREKSRDYGK